MVPSVMETTDKYKCDLTYVKCIFCESITIYKRETNKESFSNACYRKYCLVLIKAEWGDYK